MLQKEIASKNNCETFFGSHNSDNCKITKLCIYINQLILLPKNMKAIENTQFNFSYLFSMFQIEKLVIFPCAYDMGDRLRIEFELSFNIVTKISPTLENSSSIIFCRRVLSHDIGINCSIQCYDGLIFHSCHRMISCHANLLDLVHILKLLNLSFA